MLFLYHRHHQGSPLCFQDGQLFLIWDCSKCSFISRHNSCFDLPNFLDIYQFSLFQFHPSIYWYTYVNNLANCLLFVHYNQVRSIVFKLVISLYAKIPKDFDFLWLSNSSRDVLIVYRVLVSNFQSAQIPSYLPLYSVRANAEHSQTMWLTDSSALLHNLHF